MRETLVLGTRVGELPLADEMLILSHRDEILGIAESLCLTDVRYASGNKLIATPGEGSPPVPLYEFSAKVTVVLGAFVQVYSPVVAARAKTSLGIEGDRPL